MDWLKGIADDEIGRTLLTIAGTLLITAFGVFLGALKEILLNWWERRRLVNYQAMLIAAVLDQFITDCIELIYDPKHIDLEGVVHGTVSNPTINWPPEIDWPSIPSELMYRCLLLPSQAKAAAEQASFVAEHVSGPPDYSEYFEELELKFAEVGLQAFHIMKRLKESYGVHSKDRYDVDPQEIFQGTVKSVLASKESQKEGLKTKFARLAQSESSD